MFPPYNNSYDENPKDSSGTSLTAKKSAGRTYPNPLGVQRTFFEIIA